MHSTGGFSARGEFIFSTLSNTAAYNRFAKSNVGSATFSARALTEDINLILMYLARE
jgi:hypothetical protein